MSDTHIIAAITDVAFVELFRSKYVRVFDQGPLVCWTWKGTRSSHGYAQTAHRGRTLRANRVAWVLTYGSIPDGLLVCHHCDNRMCVRPSHLFLGTNDDNMRDMAEKGRAAPQPGAKHGMSKLIEADVLSIRRLRAKGLTQNEIASRFGVRREAIGKILRGERWAHLR